MDQGKRRPAAIAAGVAIAALLAIGTATVLLMLEYGSGWGPDGETGPGHREVADPFPPVDWEALWAVNPDVIGWVSVPGTNINHPIVQAYPDWPGRWLEHQLDGSWNFTGTVYLDAECAEAGLESQNCVVYGHNMGWNDEMFADFARFSDPSFAEAHRNVYLQTPSWRTILKVNAARVIGGWEETKRTSFDDGADFEGWYSGMLEGAETVLDASSPWPNSLYTFTTCSYNRYSNERTLVFASAVGA